MRLRILWLSQTFKLNVNKGNTKGEGEGKGEGEFKNRAKAYGNITVAMIMQLSFIRYSYWFC